MRKKKWILAGYLTVESSILFPVICIMTGIMLSLTIHVYQRAWYTAAACESVLTGSGKGILEGTDGVKFAEEKWEGLQNGFYLKPERMSAQIQGDQDRVSVRAEGSTVFWGIHGLDLEIQKEMKILRPVKFIRKAVAWKDGGA